MNHLPNETTAQWRGRIKRETNAANDALKLQEGEPVHMRGRDTRFHPRMIDRVRPAPITRLVGENLDIFLAIEKAKKERAQADAARQAEREAFYALPYVQDADTIRHILEDRLKDVIDRLTHAEWADFRKKLEGE